MSICEKRYLLALAAEHGRVDIIKAILQPKGSYQEKTMKNPLIQLLLNNRILAGIKVHNASLDSYTFGKKDLEPNFIPPLHISIQNQPQPKQQPIHPPSVCRVNKLYPN
mmetsp:Transcript_11930/g.16979  ORF Transcript_11930/g.16979 Transcript_11930/m.16979 type:complete len:109 (+) Transcript_11930:209-535(+)